MSQTSERSREDSDTQSKQSFSKGVNAQRKSPTGSQTRTSPTTSHQPGSPTGSQQRSSSQVERTQENGRGERKRITRSVSSSGSDSSEPSVTRKQGGGRTEIITTTTTQKQSPEVIKGPNVATNGSQNLVTNSQPITTTSQGVSSGSFGSTVSGERRKGRFRQETIRLPDQPQGPVRQVRHRMPTPEPDTLERVYIQRTGAEVVEEITEIPMTPPPIVKERTEVEPAGPPQVVKRVIRVPPRGGAQTGYQQQQQPIQPSQQQFDAGLQYSSNLTSTGSYSSAQQVTSSYQQYTPAGQTPQAAAVYPEGFGGVAATAVDYSSVGSTFGAAPSGYPQQQPSLVFTVGGDGRSQVMPPIGCSPVFCFYL